MFHVPQLFRVCAAVLVLTALLGVGACAQHDHGGSTGPDNTQPGTEDVHDIDLTVELSGAPGAAPRTFKLVATGPVPADGSTVPDPAAALAAVERHGEKTFFPVPDPARMCTQQYGGPEVAVVTGWFKGKTVNATFKRTDGCEIARWQALAPLFGASAGAI
ncbi:serine protease inhibitor [Specibacter sp. NPDC057265]|uniref:serine protease inhibitor n=1 Tax=Specibacter sp. NPDC057265 TaxID=3346075 RepID=UPI003630AE3B